MENLHDFVVDELQRAGKSEWEAIGAATGISKHTILKIARRITKSPRYNALQPLAEYFKKQQQQSATA